MKFRYGALFDMDGVIVDNSEYHALAFEEWGREKGIALDHEYFNKHLFGKQSRDIFITLLGHELSKEELEVEDERKEFLYRQLYAEHIKPLNGLLDFLAALKESGFGLALATSGPPANVEFAIEAIGAQGLFDAFVTSQDVTKGKPDPQVFLVAASRLDLNPAQCVVFEDSVAGGKAAITSGATLIGVATGRPQLDGAARMISDFSEITANEVIEIIDKR